MLKRIGRTLPCKSCGELYHDNIDHAVDIEKSGYIICPVCAMKPPEKIRLSLSEIVDAMQEGRLNQWRTQNGVSRLRLAKILRVSEKAIRRVEANGRPSKRIYEAIVSLYLASDKTPTKAPRNQIAENWYSTMV